MPQTVWVDRRLDAVLCPVRATIFRTVASVDLYDPLHASA